MSMQSRNQSRRRDTTSAVERSRTLGALVDVLDKFHEVGFSYDHDGDHGISTATKEAATALLRCLPQHCALPKLSPDDEEGVVMVWEDGERTVLLTVDGWTLHLVRAPARNASDYLDDIPFDGDDLRDEILSSIPKC